MLNVMRKYAKSLLIKIILGIIIIVFIFYFGSLRGDRQTRSIAVIDGKSISYADFQTEYGNLVAIYRQRFGNHLTDDVVKKLNLKQQALDNLINRAIALRQADELKLYVNDDEVRNSILSHPAFQRNGHFDNQAYRQTLSHYRMSPEDFEASQKTALKIAKLEELIRNSVKVSEREAHDIYRIMNEKINLEFLKIPASSFKSRVKPADATLKKHFGENRDRFRIPERVQIKYIEFRGTDFTKAVTVSEDEITEYYDLHKSRFTGQGGKVLPISVIRDRIVTEIKAAKGMEAAFEEAQNAHDIIYQEENFEDYALAHRLKINTTGFFAKANPPVELSHVEDIAKHAFELREGEIGPLLSTSEGYYLLKPASRQKSYIPEFEEIKKEVEKDYIDKESQKLCRQKAEEILKRLKGGEDIHSFAPGGKFEISETGFFTPNSNIPGIGFSRELGESLFLISDKRPYPDNVFYVDGCFVIIKLKETGKLDDKDFDAQKDDIENILLKIKGDEYFQSCMEGIRASMIKEGKIKIIRNVSDL